MAFLLAFLLSFKVLNIPYTHKNNYDLLSLAVISKTFDLETAITDTTVNISFGTDAVYINREDLSYQGKVNGNLKYMEVDSQNGFIDAENAVYIAGALKGNYYYWDRTKHRVIESAYTPSIKSLNAQGNLIRIVHNIDLEPEAYNKDSIIEIKIPYGFYFGPPYIYFDDVHSPIKEIEITYSSHGTVFTLKPRRKIKFKIRSSTGLFTLMLISSTTETQETNKITNIEKHPEASVNKPEKPTHNKIDVVVIDPGHGGKDPGAISKRGTKEKDIVLSIARKVAKKLRKKGFKVILTRNKDVFITLGQRARIANKSKCDLFVSIHANYSKGKRAHGVETYFLSEARTKWERSVAAFENSVIKYELKEKVDEKNILKWILGDMAQNEFLRESQDLAAFVQESIVKKTGCLDRGVKQAGFYVLRGVYAPSILIETGFITNPKEEKKLRSKKYQNRLADGIVSGILKYKNYYERKYGKY